MAGGTLEFSDPNAPEQRILPLEPNDQRRIDQQLEIVRLLLAAGATLADTDRNGTTVADRINSQALRQALAAGQL